MEHKQIDQGGRKIGRETEGKGKKVEYAIDFM
jgi:hypothetical protein